MRGAVCARHASSSAERVAPDERHHDARRPQPRATAAQVLLLLRTLAWRASRVRRAANTLTPSAVLQRAALHARHARHARCGRRR